MIHDNACEGVHNHLQHVTVIARTIQANTYTRGVSHQLAVNGKSTKEGTLSHSGIIYMVFDLTSLTIQTVTVGPNRMHRSGRIVVAECLMSVFQHYHLGSGAENNLYLLYWYAYPSIAG